MVVRSVELCNDPTTAKRDQKPSWDHRWLAYHALFEFDEVFDRVEAGAASMQQLLATMEPSFDRYLVRERWMLHLDAIGQDDAVLGQIDLLHAMVDHEVARSSAVRHLQKKAVRDRRPDLWALAVARAQAALETLEEDVADERQHPYYQQLYRSLIDREMPR